MSNALSTWLASSSDLGRNVLRAVVAEASRPTSRPGTPIEDPLYPDWFVGLMAIGLIALLVWVTRRVVRPGKLSLARAPGRQNRLDPLHILFLLALWLSAGLGTTSLLRSSLGNDSLQLRIAAGLAGQVVWLVASLALAACVFQRGLFRGLGLSGRHWVFDTLRGVVAYLAVLPVCVGLLTVTLLLLPEDLVHGHVLLMALGQVSPAWRVGAVLSAVVMAPLAEEIFFRGLVQSTVRRFVNAPWVSVVLASGLFVLVHAENPQNLPSLLALSLVLGYNYERTGRLWPSIVAHALFNAVFVSLELSRT
jgi:membrane protease YdiL (CAAX protease family)